MSLQEVLCIENLQVYQGNRLIVKDMNSTFYRGECVGIIGANGSGKTTLLKAMRHMIDFHGTVTIHGQSIRDLSHNEVAKRIAYMQQHVEIPYAFTAEHIVMTGRYPYQSWWEQENKKDKDIVRSAMEYTGVWHLRHTTLDHVSGGEKQRILLAKCLAQESPIMFLDEPTSALDMGYSEDMFRAFRRLSEEGRTMIIVVHDLELAAKYCSRLLVIGKGHILGDDVPERVLTPSILWDAFHMKADVYEDTQYQRLRIEVLPHHREWSE